MNTSRKLVVGERVPRFSAHDMEGKHITLASQPSPYTLIVFLRYAGCPLCNLALSRLSLEYSLLRKNGCEVIAFVQSTPENIEKNIYRRQKIAPQFAVVADHDRKFYRKFTVNPVFGAVKYGIRYAPQWLQATQKLHFHQKNIDGNFFMVPAFFLVDRKGIVRLVDYAANFYDDTTFTPIYEVLTFAT